MTSLPILVISLATCHERRRFMAGQLEALGLPFEFIDAVDGRQLPPDFLAERASRRGVIAGGSAAVVPAEIGCALSHVRCAERIVEAGWPGAIILEDDPTLTPAFAEFAQHFDPAHPHWPSGSVIILGGLEDERPCEPDRKRLVVGSLHHRIPAGPTVRIARSVKSERYFIRTCGYYIDRQAAQALAAYNREAETVADNWRGFLAAGVLRHIAVPQPWLLSHPPETQVRSLIEPERLALRACSERRKGRLSMANRRLKNLVQPVLRRLYCLLP